jgi:hypothetical protein
LSKEVVNHIAFKISLNEGGLNHNPFHHLQYTSTNAVTLVTVITPASCLAQILVRLTHLGID